MKVFGASVVAGLAFFIASSGCSSSEPSPAPNAVGRTESAVQGGTLDQTDSFAVGVCGGSPGQCQLFCSGALIAPNLVVTARHCVTNSPQQIDCATAKFGTPLGPPGAFHITTSYNMFQSTQGWHTVSQVITPTPTGVCGNDIALLILAQNVPASEATPITPAVQYPITDHTRYSTTDTAIGFGLTTPANQNTVGQRHKREGINIECIPGDAQINCNPAQAFGGDQKELLAGDGTCEGDSGSSAYEQTSYTNKKPVSLGVLSRGGISADGTTCIGAVYTRLDSWKDLIISTAKTAAQQGGYPPPDWTYAPGTPPPPPDAGTKPAPDSGSSGSSGGPAPGDFGASCGNDGDCNSNACRDNVCTRSCDTQNTCPDGYACNGGFCSPKKAATNSATSTTTSGCAVAPGAMGQSGRRDPTQPIPWRWLGLGLLGVAVLRRRSAK